MKIGIDAYFATSSLRGMGRVILGYLEGLADIDEENEYYVYAPSDGEIDKIPNSGNFNIRSLNTSVYPLYEQISLPLAAYRDDLDILHCPANTTPLLLFGDAKLVLTLHDVIFHKSYSEIPKSDELHQSLGRIYRRSITTLIQNKVDYCITVSNNSRLDIENELNLQAPIQVIYPGIDDIFFSTPNIRAYNELTSRHSFAQPYIFHLGGSAPSKNTLSAIKAFERYTNDNDDNKTSLLIRGVEKDADNRIVRYVENSDVKERIRFLPFLTDEELHSIYAKADVFMSTSLYEGYGLPLIEALASGTPVIGPNRGSVPEIVGDNGILVDPENEREIADALNEALSVNNDVDYSIATSNHSQSWNTVAKELLSIYNRVVEK
ncbi:glycosyltransferase involved in cell wall biosynthesis [Haloarcula quadrata]|uniref:Glycosyltransferase involved in cell wall biosynthesis n=1 Tax=Haloarcula quadrata TaxID=182779 RepID=A0A495R830_9EURY|nr:glycosyltransferase family 1 protein [Haloarcula quadrata]RKS83224.1 glycosyltransferase involved in cell wall biosynthesis [Haloarcula quadrata]